MEDGCEVDEAGSSIFEGFSGSTGVFELLRMPLDSPCYTRFVIITVRDAINDRLVLIIVFNVSNTKYLLVGFRNDMEMERNDPWKRIDYRSKRIVRFTHCCARIQH